MKKMRVLVLLLVGTLWVLSCNSTNPITPPRTDKIMDKVDLPFDKLTDREKNTFKEMKSAVTDSMKDPDSVHFRNLQFYYPTGGAAYDDKGVNQVPGTGMWALCGEINSKNAMGGYVGYTNFYYVVIKQLNQPTIRQLNLDDSMEPRLHEIYVTASEKLCTSE